tara:strand:+ start:1011 stop:1643 length:633 start_codon:yes stop_codon:yes gene_type:complete
MNWFTLLKQPELRTGSKVTTNLGSSSNNESDGPCKKKILEYRDKLKNMDGILTDLTIGYNQKREGLEWLNDYQGSEVKEEIRLYINGVYPEFAEETRFSLLPEEVACKAIKMFSEAVPQQYGRTIVRDEIGGHLLEVRKTTTEYLGKMHFEIAFVIAIKTAPFKNSGGLTVVDLTHRISLPSDMSKESMEYMKRRKVGGSLLEKMDWGRT